MWNRSPINISSALLCRRRREFNVFWRNALANNEITEARFNCGALICAEVSERYVQ